MNFAVELFLTAAGTIFGIVILFSLVVKIVGIKDKEIE